MVSNSILWMALLGTAIVNIIMRIFPILFCKKPIENEFLNSFLKYVPFGVLTALILPEVFSSTASNVSAIAAVVVSIILSLLGQNLLTVSMVATGTVFLVERLLGL